MPTLVLAGDPCDGAEDPVASREMLDAVIDVLESAGWTVGEVPGDAADAESFRRASFGGRAKFDVPVAHAAERTADFLMRIQRNLDHPLYLLSASFAPREWRASVCYPSDASETN